MSDRADFPRIHIFLRGESSRMRRDFPDDKGRSAFLAFRDLDEAEVSYLRMIHSSRVVLSPLTGEEGAEFKRQFNVFWDQVVSGFKEDHFFWRNVVSSKMQEWDESLAYFGLVLFTLLKHPPGGERLAVLLDSVEEAEVLAEWGRQHHWKVSGLPGLQRARLIQVLRDVREHSFGALIFIRRWLRFTRGIGVPSVEADSVLASMAYASAFSRQGYNDHFFGVVHQTMAAMGRKTVYLVEPLGEYDGKAVNREGAGVPVVFTYQLLTGLDMLLIIGRVLCRGIGYRRSIFMSVDMGVLLSRNSRRFAVGQNYYGEIFYQAMGRALRRWAPGTAAVVFEGNVMERSVIQASRRRGVAVSGYSHAVIYPLNLKFMLSPAENRLRPEPDRFITCGEGNAYALVRQGGRKQELMAVACSFKGDWRKPVPVPSGQAGALVALDGSGQGSVVAMVEWLVMAREALGRVNIILRPHPNIPEGYIRRQVVNDIPEGFVFSGVSLQDDLARVMVVIYRSSSVGIQALLCGIPAVRLSIDMPLRGDIIDQPVFGWQEVSTPQGLTAAVERAVSFGDGERRRIREEAQSVYGRFFMLPGPENVRVFGEAIGNK